MSKSLKAITFAIGALIGLLVLAVGVLFIFLDINAYKPGLKRPRRHDGMEVKVGGRLESLLSKRACHTQ